MISFLIALKLLGVVVCQCDGTSEVLRFKKRIVICGSIVEKASDCVVVSEFSAKDCLTGKYIMDNRLDAAMTYKVSIRNDSLSIVEMLPISDSSMVNLQMVPFFRQTITLSKNSKVTVSAPRYVLKMPQLTEFQKRHLDSLCKYLLAETNQTRPIYPLDENSIYNLFTGALSGHATCYDLLVNLRQTFVLDGGIAETYGELPLNYMIDNKIIGRY